MSLKNYIAILIGLSCSMIMSCDGIEQDSQREESNAATVDNRDQAADRDADASSTGPDGYTYAHLYLVHAYDTDDENLFASGSAASLVEDKKKSDDPTAFAFKEGVFQKMLDMLFEVADANKSNSISLEEFAAFRISELPLDEDAINRIKAWREKKFKEADTNEDGSLDKDEAKILLKISRGDVRHFRKNHGAFASIAAKFHKAMIKKYDLNDDGKLSKEERQKMQSELKSAAEKYSAKLKVACENVGDAAAASDIQCILYGKVKKFCQENDDTALPMLATFFSAEKKARFCKKYFSEEDEKDSEE